MRYSIFTVMNSAYFYFGKIFIDSLFKNIDVSNISNIFIADTGLNKEHKNYLSSFEKVLLVDTKYNIQESMLWDKNWLDNVKSKTETLYNLLLMYEPPIVMIDVDSMFVRNFEEFLDFNYDVQVAKRDSKSNVNVENHPVPYIGSFVSINNNQGGKLFLRDWIDRIDTIPTIPKESRALSQICVEKKPFYKIGDLLVREISSYADRKYLEEFDTRIVHFKSRGKFKSGSSEDFIDRTVGRGYLEDIREYVDVQGNISK